MAGAATSLEVREVEVFYGTLQVLNRVSLSARGGDQKWRLGFAHFRYSRMLAELSGAQDAAPRPLASRVPIGHSEDEP